MKFAGTSSRLAPGGTPCFTLRWTMTGLAGRWQCWRWANEQSQPGMQGACVQTSLANGSSVLNWVLNWIKRSWRVGACHGEVIHAEVMTGNLPRNSEWIICNWISIVHCHIQWHSLCFISFIVLLKLKVYPILTKTLVYVHPWRGKVNGVCM